ncbi:MAG: chromosome segregation protein SMC [Candidatus Omnitrophica bacterium]|nr:chromosome segregation protein SMC [Candidatus Omnitrophota bacterium]
MRLKKLEIFGFKSFADKTTIVFDEGVTCIVGPNGCGKSNISDSIRWVLGERSPKVLRGSKMEDIIFNGTDFRKPLGFTEVSLTLDNSDRTLPIDYQEVTLTRRLHRSGESEYLINKTSCRLKDIHDLILDTGLGSSTYSMIEQGKIDYILNANPDERRFLIEEAAGISKYEAKKDEAIRKLERTEENRLRLNDILHEVQKNIQYAERQAKRAQKYRENYERLKDLEVRKAFYDIQKLDADSQKISAEEGFHQSELQRIEGELAKVRQQQSELNEISRGILDRYSGEDSKRHQIQSKMEQNEQALRFHQEKLVEIASRRGQIEQEVYQLTERIQKSQHEKKEKEHAVESLHQEKERATQFLARSEAQMKSIEAESLETRKLLEQIKAETFRIAMQISQFRNDFHKTSAFLETSEERQRKEQQNILRLEKEIHGWKTKQETYGDELVTLGHQFQDIRLKKSELQQTLEKNSLSLEGDRSQLQKWDREIHELETQLKILIEIDTQAEITERTILNHLDTASSALTESLHNIFDIRKGYEWALEAALDSFSKSFMVENLETANKLLEQIQAKKPSWMGLLVKDGLPELETWNSTSESARPIHPLIDCALEEVVQIREGYSAPVKSFLKNVYLTHPVTDSKSFEELYALSGSLKLLTPDGTILGPQGRISYRQSDAHSESGVFQRASEIKSIETGLKQKHLEHMNALIALKNQEIALQALEMQLDQLDSDITDRTIQKESLESHHQSIDERLQSLHKERQIIVFESEEFQLQWQETLLLKEKLEKKTTELETEEKKVRETQENLIRSLEATDQAKSSALKELTECQVRFHHFEEQFRLLNEGLKMLEAHEKEDQKRLAQIQDEAAQLTQKENDTKKKNETIRIEQSDWDKLRRESEISLELIRREKDNAEQALNASREIFETVQQKNQDLQQSLHQFEIKKMDLGYQEKTIHERLNQLYKIQLSDFNADLLKLEADITEVERVIQDLRGKIDSIGTVNLLAIEEYDELKARHDFLQAQMKDLEDAREALLETIRQINRTTKTLFEQTFVEVQKMFQEYYQILFRGGSAKLMLTDESHPLESGIDIVVRPPGKKLQHITLLSGGEKALTAIALLFALFKIKPSPFCVLDEVDAPLDEANVDRFIGVLQTFLKLSQFIIVTHNRKTIAMGNVLYGVTMQEAGVSKLVSVKINQDQKVPQTPESAAEQIPSKSIEEQLQS